MKVTALLHAEFEQPGLIKDWFVNRGHEFNEIKLYAGEKLTGDNSDMFVVMGGPMNIYEEDKYPWLSEEKIFLKNAVKNNKKILGICLGAQLIADVLGAKVYKNIYKEIGWFPVKREKGFSTSYFFRDFPETACVLQWHGDTFDIPDGCVKTAFSEGCPNQGFEYGDQILALQFHLEADSTIVKKMVENCGNEIVEAKYIQKEGELILGTKKYSEESNYLMGKILEKYER